MSKLITLKRNNHFKKVIKDGRYAVAHHIVLYTIKNGENHNRIGIIVTKKVGKSVVRNYIRRIIKENYKKLSEKTQKGMDIVIIVRARENPPTYKDIKKEMEYVIRKLQLFVQE